MTDKEIIKALECCISPECDNCPYDGDDLLRPCNHNLMKDALDLINRQQTAIDVYMQENDRLKTAYIQVSMDRDEIKAENDELKREREVMLEDIHHSADQINEQIEELEDARREIERLRENNKAIMQTMADVHTEAIKEFAKRLCKDRVSNDPVVIAVKCELKEMVGEDK